MKHLRKFNEMNRSTMSVSEIIEKLNQFSNELPVFCSFISRGIKDDRISIREIFERGDSIYFHFGDSNVEEYTVFKLAEKLKNINGDSKVYLACGFPISDIVEENNSVIIKYEAH